MVSNNSRSQSTHYFRFLEIEELKDYLRQQSVHYPYYTENKDHLVQLASKEKSRIPMSQVKSFWPDLTRQFEPRSLWELIQK